MDAQLNKSLRETINVAAWLQMSRSQCEDFGQTQRRTILVHLQHGCRSWKTTRLLSEVIL